MFCPECGDEYQDGIATCAECGVALTPEPPPEPVPEQGSGTHGGYDQVAETNDVLEGELIALRLREGGFEPQVVDQTFHQEPIPAVRAMSVVRVLVAADRADEARALLAQSVPLPEDGEDQGGEPPRGPEEPQGA